MKINAFADATALSDGELLVRLRTLASAEREASAELVAHLAALDARPALYAAEGFGSLFSYCTVVLRLSEDAACNRIEAARVCGRFPEVVELLASGAVTLTSLRLLRRHLTPENHQEVLARASGGTRKEIESLVAELAPRPDAPNLVRRLPVPSTGHADTGSSAPLLGADACSTSASSSGSGSMADPLPAETASAPAPIASRSPRPRIQATAPERYRVQLTIGAETHAQLRRLQDLLRREIPSGDPAVIFARAVALLLETVEKTKLAATTRPRPKRSIRPGTDSAIRTPIVESRHIPSDVKRDVWRRDAGQCAYVAPSGRRCDERAFLELHHVQPFAKQGPATVANIALRCRRHNQYEAEMEFGPRPRATAAPVRESIASPAGMGLGG
jgi:hypothetical protein